MVYKFPNPDSWTEERKISNWKWKTESYCFFMREINAWDFLCCSFKYSYFQFQFKYKNLKGILLWQVRRSIELVKSKTNDFKVSYNLYYINSVLARNIFLLIMITTACQIHLGICNYPTNSCFGYLTRKMHQI